MLNNAEVAGKLAQETSLHSLLPLLLVTCGNGHS